MKKLKESMGFWKAEDCKNVSDAAGLFLYYSKQVLEESSELREAGKELQAISLEKEALLCRKSLQITQKLLGFL